MSTLANGGAQDPGRDVFEGATRHVMGERGGYVDVAGWLVRVARPEWDKVAYHTFDFTGHPLRELILPYLLSKGPDIEASSVGVHAQGLERLGRFLRAANRTDITAQGFGEMLEWMKQHQASSSRRQRRRAAAVVAELSAVA